jgi:NAD+ kinase
MHKIAVLAYTEREDAVTWAHYATRRLVEEGVEVYIEDSLAEITPADLLEKVETCAATEFERYADMLITFGGDGTLLAASHLLIGSDVPIMGVNVGKLGFLAEFPVAMLEESIMAVLKGDYRIVDRSTLEVQWNETTVHALNEVAVERVEGSKMITLRAYVNDHHVADFRADGVLLATPTGSTAYSLAAGGPIISPSANVFCLTPISPHTLTVRPLIVSDTSEVRFMIPPDAPEAQLVADGRAVGTMKGSDVAVVRKSDHLIKLVKRADSTYFDLLREKLLWSADSIRKTV